MPSVVRIERQGREYAYAWVEAEVVRIGSNPQCDIVVDEAEPWAATLVFRQGAFSLIHRGAAPLVLAGRPLAPGEQREWPSGTKLQVARDVDLQLYCHRDPTPTEPLPGQALPDPDAPLKKQAERREFWRQTWAVCVAAICLMTTAWLIKIGRGGALPDAWFSQVVEGLRVAESGGDQAAGEVRDFLQRAYACEASGQSDLSRLFYVEARKRLDAADAAAIVAGASLRWQSDALDFVAARLGRD